MIPKIICWLFGHDKWRRTHTTHEGFDLYVDHYIQVDKCERCGATL